MIINISSVWRRVELRHTRFLTRRIIKGQELLASFVGPGVEHKLYNFIEAHKKLILSVNAIDFSPGTRDYDTLFRDEKGKAKELLKKVFDYSAFIDFQEGWDAYKLCEKSEFNFCPYCHIAGIETHVKGEGKKYRPNLDHYIGKSDYPFLALTLGNLIPCCEKCNGPQMKGRIDFLATPHLNPLVDREIISFSLKPRCNRNKVSAAMLGLQLNEGAYKLCLSISGALQEEAVNSIRTFQLSKRYQVYIGEALSLARQVKSQGRLNSLNAKFPDLDIRPEDYISIATAKDYRNSHGGKMRLDILRQYT